MGTALIVGMCAGVVLTLVVIAAIDRYESIRAAQRQAARVVPLKRVK